MDNSYCIDYHNTGAFSKLFLDYIDESENLKSFYQYKPSLSSIPEAIKNKQKENINRELLVKQLKSQYSTIDTNELVSKNIELLSKSNTFTITTGHQLAIYTGEWYFIFKIITAVKMAVEAKKLYPDYNFVPVFWMASEDHDFEEINHINLGTHRFEWKENSTGPTGRISVNSLQKVTESLSLFLGNRPHTKELISIYEKSYQEGKNLAEATRTLVNELFKEYGLVIIDADDAELKKSWIPTIEKELFERRSFIKSTEQTKKIEALNYPSQIYPREINLFYILDGYRERIIFENGKYITNDKNYIFDTEILKDEIKNHPERFSPNVVLRPLYQESILPNLCYIGGPGEIAYWLQLKSVFDLHHISYPILAWRNSFMMMNKKDFDKWDELGFAIDDIFKSLQSLEDSYVSKHQTEKINLKAEEILLKNYIESMKSKANKVDSNLLYSLSGTEKRILRMMEKIEHKIWKAEKKKYKQELQKIKSLKSIYFPNNKLQERFENFSLWYANCGRDGINTIILQSDTLSKNFKVLIID